MLQLGSLIVVYGVVLPQSRINNAQMLPNITQASPTLHRSPKYHPTYTSELKCMFVFTQD